MPMGGPGMMAPAEYPLCGQLWADTGPSGEPRNTRQSCRFMECMFFFFSNRLGCFGSLLLSAAATVVLLLMFGVIRF